MRDDEMMNEDRQQANADVGGRRKIERPPTIEEIVEPDEEEQQLPEGAASRKGTLKLARHWNGALRGSLTVTFGILGTYFGLIFPCFSFFVLAAVYIGLAWILNRTIIEVGPKRLKIYHRPLPFPGAFDIPIDTIEKIYCERVTDDDGIVDLELNVITRDDTIATGVKGMSINEALYIEQRIAEHLGLVDNPKERRQVDARAKGTRSLA